MRRLAGFIVPLIVAAVGMIAVAKAQQELADTALRAAIEQETVKGDLKGAIAAYQEVADSPAHNRAIRAEALVRMGGCYQKLGDGRSKQAFERVIREFGDQTAVVAHARTALREVEAPPSNGDVTIRRLGVLPQSVNSISDSGLFAASQYNGNIVVWDVATGRMRPVTVQPAAAATQSDEYGNQPIFSPDATQVAYTWCATVTPATATTKFECEGQLRISRIRENGIDAPRTLYRESKQTAPYAWSRDGSTIAAFAHVDPGFLSDLLLISTSDGRATRLDRFPRTNTVNELAQRVAFSPDGKYVAASVLLPAMGQSDVFVYEVSSGKRMPVAATAADERLVGWTPDGRRILYSSEARGTYDLYEIGFIRGRLDGTPTMLRADLGTIDSLMVSSTGALYYATDSGRVWTVHFATLDFATGTMTTIPDGPRPMQGGSPVWTRDGAALVYLSRPNVLRGARTTLKVDANGSTREIVSPIVSATSVSTTSDANVLLVEGTNGIGGAGLYRLDVPTGKAALLAQGARGSFVSADGRRVYFFRGENGHHELVERDLATDAERTLLTYEHAAVIPEAAAVSAYGRRVYYRRPDADARPGEPKSRVIERDLVSGQERELLAGRLGHIWLSPDGRHIVVREDDPAGKWVSMRLLSVADIQPVRELMRLDAEDGLFFGAWSPDSQSVILQRWHNAPPVSWWVPIAGGAPRQLPQHIGTASSLSIHPDGKTIAFSVADFGPRQFEIWSMERFLRRP